MKNAIFKNPNGSLIYTAICDYSLDSQFVADGLIAAGTLPVGCTLVGVDLIIPDGVSVNCCEHDPVSGMILARPTSAHKLINGQWVIDPAVEAQDLTDKKTAALVELSHLHADYLSSKTGSPSKEEIASWDFKVGTATAIIENTQLTARAIAFFAASGIIDQAAWAVGVLANSAAFAKFLGIAESLRTTSKLAINTAQTQNELDAAIADIHIKWRI